VAARPAAPDSERQASDVQPGRGGEQIGSFGEHAGELANEVGMVREAVAQTNSRSPIEVVLQGLTTRRT
jgi:hypothetical protein